MLIHTEKHLNITVTVGTTSDHQSDTSFTEVPIKVKGLTVKLKPVVADDLVRDTTRASLPQLASHVFCAAHTLPKL